LQKIPEKWRNSGAWRNWRGCTRWDGRDAKGEGDITQKKPEEKKNPIQAKNVEISKIEIQSLNQELLCIEGASRPHTSTTNNNRAVRCSPSIALHEYYSAPAYLFWFFFFFFPSGGTKRQEAANLEYFFLSFSLSFLFCFCL